MHAPTRGLPCQLWSLLVKHVEIRRKNLAPRSFHGHSVWALRNWPDRSMTSCQHFIATIGQSCTVSKIKQVIDRKIAFFLNPRLFNASAYGGSPWNSATALVHKTRMMGFLAEKKFDNIFSRLEWIHDCDRRTYTVRQLVYFAYA